MNVEQRHLEEDMHFWIYHRILETVIEERKMKQKFSDLNQKILQWQVKRLETFFSKELDYQGEIRQKAMQTLKHETEKADYHINLARKKNYLTYGTEYNAATAKHELEQIARFEEEYGIKLAEKVKQRGFKRGEQILKNRPVILMEEEAMQKAREATLKAAGKGPGETAGAFTSKKLGNGKILLEDFQNWDTYDSEGSVALKDEQVEKFWGETGRDLIFWHCHPKASDMDSVRYSDRLSDGDVKMMRSTVNKGDHFGYMYGEKVGIREGLTVLTHPREYQEPQEKVYFLAPAVNNQGTAGFLKLHIVRDQNIIDGEYTWPNIYNRWIKAAMTGPDITGPYSTRK